MSLDVHKEGSCYSVIHCRSDACGLVDKSLNEAEMMLVWLPLFPN